MICGARYRGDPDPVALVALNHTDFEDPQKLRAALVGAHAVLHFAGVNRASPGDLEAQNPAIAKTLVQGCQDVGAMPHIVYANTIHAGTDTPYGRSKARAAEILADLGVPFTDLVLPHIFGECARPRYNNVTATLIEALLDGVTPEINPDGAVNLLHAGVAAQTAIDAVMERRTGRVQPEAKHFPIPVLWDKLKGMHDDYQVARMPVLADPFDVQLFNTYRAASYPGYDRHWPRKLTCHTDPRGTLFETVKAGAAGQSFASWTESGVTRGEHFHLTKVERFLVLQGQAMIRIRKVLGDEVWSYPVSGETPMVVDMPTMHTHSMENYTGNTPMLAVFWTHDIFDPAAPDTYADPVLDPAITS